MRLIEFETEDGNLMFINPEHVIMVFPGKDNEHTEIHLVNNQVVDVKGHFDTTADDLVHASE